jgi:hypothetical protein
MQGKLPRRRYCVQHYSGQLSTKTQRNTAKNVMYVKGLVNQIEKTRFP